MTFVDVDAPATFAHGTPAQALALTRPERLRATINAHDNAVFDVKWSNDDRIIVRALQLALGLCVRTQVQHA